jgi:hypothetical protein
MPGLNCSRPSAGEVNFTEGNKMRIGCLQHVHDFTPLIDDLAQGYDFDVFDNA